MSFVHKRHDIGILRQDGSTKVPMMLAQENGTPLWWTSDEEYISETERGQSKAERELPPIIGDDWRSGIGLDVYDSDDPLRYNSSVNCDLRFRGQATLSYTSTGLALPATSGAPTCHAELNGVSYIGCGTKLNQVHANGASITNVTTFASPISALETFADGNMYIGFNSTTVIEDCEDNWTADDAVNNTVSVDTGDYRVGSGSVKCIWGAGSGAPTDIYEDFTAIDLRSFEGVKFWFKCSVDTSAGDFQFLLDESANVGSPNETINLPALSAGVWTRVYLKMADPSPLNLVVSCGIRYAVDIGACTTHIDDIKAENLIQKMDNGENFTTTTESNGFAHFLKTVNGTSPALWKGLLPNEIRSATVPFAASAWGTAKAVDSPFYNITDMVSSQNTLFIQKEDRPFYLDSSGNVQVAVDGTKFLASTTGGKNSIDWQEKVYMPYGTQSLVEYDDGTITWRDPALSCASLGDYDGAVRAVTADEQYLYIIIDSATTDYIEVLVARLETISGTERWVVHAINQIAMTDCGFAFVSSIYQRRLWICSTNASNNIFYIPLPAGYGDPASDTNKVFSTSAGQYFITPKLHAGFKGDSKAFIKLSLKMSGTTDDIYWRAYYRRQGVSAWAEINATDKFKTSPITSGYIPVDGTSANPVSTTIQLKLEGKTNSTSVTPILLGYDLRAILYPSRRKVIHCVVRCDDDTLDKLGQRLEVNATTIRTTLDEAKNTATYPVTIYDPFGATKTVRFLSVDPYSKITKQEKDRDPEEKYYVAMVEVTTS